MCVTSDEAVKVTAFFLRLGCASRFKVERQVPPTGLVELKDQGISVQWDSLSLYEDVVIQHHSQQIDT